MDREQVAGKAATKYNFGNLNRYNAEIIGPLVDNLWRPVLTIGLIYVIPVLLLAYDVIPRKWRFQTLLLLTAATCVISWAKRSSWVTLGLQAPTLTALLFWTIGPLVGTVLLASFAEISNRQPMTESIGFFLFFVFVSAPAQEFLYRSFLFSELDTFGLGAVSKILISAILYAFMHIIYRDALTVGLTFVIGVIWAFAFQTTQSFWIVAVSHALVGAFAIWRGII